MLKEKWHNIAELFINGGRVVKIFWKDYPWQAFSLLVMVIIVSFSSIVSSYIYGQLINQVVNYISGEIVSKNFILTLFLLEAFVNITVSILHRQIRISQRIMSINFGNKITIEITNKLVSLDIAKLEDPKFKTKLNRIKNEAIYRPANFIGNFVWLLSNLLKAFFSMLVLINISFALLPIIIFTLIPVILVKIKSSNALWDIYGSKDHIKKRFGAVHQALTGINMIKEIRINANKIYLITIMRRLLNNFSTSQQKILIKENKQNIGVEFLETFLRIIIDGWFLLQVLATKILVGDFTFYTSIVGNFIGSTKGVFNIMGQMYEESIFMTEYYEVIDLVNEITNNPQGHKIKKSPKIEFKKVSFKYPGTKKYILKDFSLIINPGEDIAFIGENGAGKTTLILLLARFYDVTSGQILLNGHNLKDLNLDSWYNRLGILFQNFNTYSLTVQENIGLGRVNKLNNLKEIIEVAKQAGVDTFVKKFKHKYKTYLSRWFKSGEALSGGQWQRVALARAFFRNADVLILDEPTSAIDAKGEYEIFKKIAKFQKEKTTIIISHRFSTVRKADKILVMSFGKIIEQGSHSQLMQLKGGKYKEMFDLQAEGYQ